MKQRMEDMKLIEESSKVIINDVVCSDPRAGLETR
jgi:hypothetical protein